jgi:hypothetical protein
VRKGWLKFAISGEFYARALSNAAARGGGRVGAPVLSAIAGQPRAQLMPGLSEQARQTRELPTDAPGRNQGLFDRLKHVPLNTEGAFGDHRGDPQQLARFNAALRRGGTVTHQPGTQQMINESFGTTNAFKDQKADEQDAAREAIKAHRAAAPAPNAGEARPNPALDAHRQSLWPTFHRLTGGGGGEPASAPPPITRGEPTKVLPDAFSGLHAAPSPVAGSAIGHAANTGVVRSPTTPPRQFLHAGLQAPKIGAALPAALGIGAPLALGAGLLAHKPGIQSNLRALAEGGSTQERDVSGDLPPEAVQQADAIHQALLTHGLDPRSVRMGIDAPPGSGKTTLARALAQQAGFKHYGLDWEPGNWWKSTIGRGRNVEGMPHVPRAGEVLEHYMLNRSYDPEVFDAQVHIHRDPEILRKQLQQRGHGAYIGDTMDLGKSLGVADLGFDTLGGEMIDLGNGVQMKLRPREGWGDVLDQRLTAAGVDPTGLSRHEKLLSLQAGKRTTGAGWTPYLKSPFSGGEMAAIGASVPLGLMAAKMLARRPL